MKDAASGRYPFGTDFREPVRAAPPAPDMEAALAAAYARGLADGTGDAAAAASRRLADTAEALAAAVAGLLGAVDAELDAIETDAVAFARTLATTLAGRALAAEPLAAVEEAAAEAFLHVRGVPHLVLRVMPACVETAETLVRTRARESGFEGRIIVLGDDGAGDGQARIEWADGGVARDVAAVRHAVEATIARLSHPLGTSERRGHDEH